MGKSKKKRGNKGKTEQLEDKILVEKLLTITRSNGLIAGTNAVLRNLEKNRLSAVILCSDKVCTPIYRAVSLWCKETVVPLFVIGEEDRTLMDSKLHVSIAYGIKKDCMHLHPQLEQSLNLIKQSKKQKSTLDQESRVIIEDSVDSTPDIDCRENETINFSCHEKHALKEKKEKKIKLDTQADFLAFGSSSDSEEELVSSKSSRFAAAEEFPVYKSVKWKSTELIIK